MFELKKHSPGKRKVKSLNILGLGCHESKLIQEERQTMIDRAKEKAIKHYNELFNNVAGINYRKAIKKYGPATVLLASLALGGTGCASPYRIEIIPENGYKQTNSREMDQRNILNKDEILIAVIDTDVNEQLSIFKDKVYTPLNLTNNKNSHNIDEHGNMVSSVITNTLKDYPNEEEKIRILPINNDVIDAPEAIRIAVDNGARIINCSFKYKEMSEEAYRKLQDSIDYAYQKNVVVVAGIGNDGENYINSDFADLNHVIAVGAVDNNLKPCNFTTINEAVFASDLGENVVVTDYNGKTKTGSGTSFATPRLSAKIAVLIKRYPQITVDQIREIIMLNSIDLGYAGRDDGTGYGMFEPDLVKLEDCKFKGGDIEYPHIILFRGYENKDKIYITFKAIDESNIDMSSVSIDFIGTSNNKIFIAKNCSFTENMGNFTIDATDLPNGEYNIIIKNLKDDKGNELKCTKRYFNKR